MKRRSGGSRLVLCSDCPDWQSDHKWGCQRGGGGRGRWSEAAKHPLSIPPPLRSLSSTSTNVAKVSEDRMRRRKDNQLRDLPRSVNDWGRAALGRLNNSDAVDLYHESAKFVPSFLLGLLIMFECTKLARQPSHWVNLNGSNLRGQERQRGAAGRDLLCIRT